MSNALPMVQIQLIETVVTEFKQFASSLKPVDDKNGWFFHIVFELMDATVSNYHQLRIGYRDDNNHLLAWACRNLLELAVFTKYVLISEANARRFGDDRLIDGSNIIESLKALELHINAHADTTLLDDALARMQAQMAAENVTATKYLAVGSLAETVGMKEEYACMNKVCSKLVHPTAWSILAVNKGDNAFSQFRPIFFQAGAQYFCDLYSAIKEHNAAHGMKPKP
jgi:hypothetical protein